ncbi:hypothetical protein L3Q82_024762 [Scortum barcoo]|uniref:Uncharacterized protein n=1 Tax=Scortum barcoo TaxID=214431 RepID=A0ACB8WQF8_9TELE|nr:hypothetical protein L3Q82_024762 [Scortum barcoo]
MEVGDSTSGVANRGGGQDSVFQLQGERFSASPGRSRPGYWRERIWPIVEPQNSGGTMRFSSQLWNTGPALYPPSRVLEGLCKFAQPVHMCFVDLEKAVDCVPRGILHAVWGPRPLAKGCSVSVRLEQELGLQGRRESRFGNHRISSLLFADDIILLVSSNQDLQHVLGQFAAGMRISTSKSEAMVLDRKRVACPLRVGGEVLPQVEEFKYLGVLFTSEGKMEHEIDRRIGAASAVMRSVYRTIVVKMELSRKANLSIYRSVYAPTLTYGHELWRKGEKLSHSGGAGARRVELLLLHIERSQLRWLRHLFRMPPGRLPREGVPGMSHQGGGPGKGRPRTRWRDYVSQLAWERLGVPPEELEEVSGVREVWASLLQTAASATRSLDKRKKMDG